MARPLVLIHGYSATCEDFKAFIPLLRQLGQEPLEINVCNYISLSNEITVRDIAEGFDRAIRYHPKLKDGQEFDAIVHSTGMLVIRTWLTEYGTKVSQERLKRLKHLIGIAPATWGSPQAHKGRTWLGALVKGKAQLGPDFMEAGDLVLDALELGSRYTWDLAHADLLGEGGKKSCYRSDDETPWVAIFIGNQPYDGVSSVANDPGTDGTVRWAGCGLNARKITIDLTRTATDRVCISPWGDRLNVPPISVPGRNHGTIIQNPEPGMMKLIQRFLQVGNGGKESFDGWLKDAQTYSGRGVKRMLTGSGGDAGGVKGKVGSVLSRMFHPEGEDIEGWQQFVVRARDERGDPITDYMLEIEFQERGKWKKFEQMYTMCHPYSTDPSFRNFHIRLGVGLTNSSAPLRARISAHTGSELLAYQGYDSDGNGVAMRGLDNQDDALVIRIDNQLGEQGGTFFFPFTTTLVEIILNREPVPLDGECKIVTVKMAEG
jgi:pimeloyl-ACP methyl ester carboxylesterase